MSEPVAKARPQIDVDEFERMLREPAASQPHAADDPLAELARLVGNIRDPYDEMFSRGEAPSARAIPRPSVDFSAIEAGLRGTYPGHSEPAFRQDHFGQEQLSGDGQNYYAAPEAQHAAQDGQYGGDQQWAPKPYTQAAPQRQARSRRPVYATAAIILLGIAGIGIAFAYKGSNSGPREVAMIKAAPGPSKIQPPADDSSAGSSRDGSALDNAPAPSPVKTVNHEEQPVDLAQSVQDSPRTMASNGIQPIYNFGMSQPGNGDPAAPPAIAAQGGPESRGVASDIPPVRVKTRSYRPDGTPIQDDHIPAAAIDNAAAAPAKPASSTPVAKASTPRTSAAAKTTTRAAPAVKAPAATKPVVLAARDPDAPTDLSPNAARVNHVSRPFKPVETAEAKAETGPVATGEPSGFAVQLAAPGSEAEARQTAARLGSKFASELGGRHLGTYKAVSNGKTVYRVRVPGMSREDAIGLCEKLKSGGGSCFIAKS